MNMQKDDTRRESSYMRTLLISILCLTFVVTAAAEQPASSVQPGDWDLGMKLREAEDLNPDPHILEINLEARIAEVEVTPGVRVNAWTYDGGLPGPLIRLNVGDR